MPTVFTEGPYRFFFYSDEGTEPPHLHVAAAEKRAKYWLLPIELVWSDGFRSGELKAIRQLIETNHVNLLGEWNAHFSN